ncbi:hypothetical protein N8J89_31315 [Crossiella sp. CA-258035]|uniref:hypothetical protein n=1 Tax=Crossiella sp. CA-258035 TaxID=2981138 RepID=UPI0024BC5EE9|nr:hypothetical protein [Crossiella sp. CA-258035]WHT17586.1 hypothetical protein N8J89_31315 [Crossiella sp. CA-258035]
MPPITDATALLISFGVGAWCATNVYALRTIRVISTTAINRAKPCDLAAVLGALPGVLGRIGRLRLTTRGLG